MMLAHSALLFAGSLLVYRHYYKRMGQYGALGRTFSSVWPLLLEVSCFLALAIALRGRRGFTRRPVACVAFGVVTLLFTLAMVAQWYALLYSNAFISALALENIRDAGLTARWSQPAVLGLGAMVSMLTVWASRRPTVFAVRSWVPWSAWPVAIVTGVGALVCNARAPVANGVSGLRPWQSPVGSIASTLHSYWRQAYDEADYVTLSDAQRAKPYPYMKKWVNRRPLPFASLASVDNPNVIVLFIEGFSARLLEPYGGRYSGLTPNLQALSHEAMVVDNYYNHTAATYRGLQGQLVSGDNRFGGVEAGGWEDKDATQARAAVSYFTLPQVLHAQGYYTAFMSPHPDEIPLNRMLEALHFDDVFTRERSVGELMPNDALQPWNHTRLTDHDQFLALRRFMEKHEGSQPFFVGLYNMGTHAFLDSDPLGVRYGDGTNPSLNTIHNLDAQLGQFIDYLRQSTFRDNTLLVVTADHAHYPEPPYVAVAGEYDHHFVDRIPMFVRAPWLRLPERFDAHDLTSLGFAPTVLHLLHIDNADNAFLGRSIFSPPSNADTGLRVAPLGTSVFAIHRGRVYAPDDIPEELLPEYRRQVAVVGEYQANEHEGRIAPPYRAGSMISAAGDDDEVELETEIIEQELDVLDISGEDTESERG